MNEGGRNQYLYISSKNRHSGNVYDFDVVFNAGLIKAQENEEIRISLVQLSMPLTLNQINTKNNTLNFKNLNTNATTSVTIPVGNWNVYDLAFYVKNAYTAISSLTFSKATNHFIFSFAQPHQITFINSSNVVFGFSSSTSLTGTTIESDTASIPNPINDIILSVFGVSPVSHNLDNFLNQNMRMSHMLGMMPIDDIPFGVMRYENTNGEFSTSLGDKEIKKLRFVMTDIYDSILDYCDLPEYTALIKIKYVIKHDENMKVLKDIRDFTKYSFLANNIGQQ